MLSLVPVGAVGAQPESGADADGIAATDAGSAGSDPARPTRTAPTDTGVAMGNATVAAEDENCVVNDTVTGSAYPEHFEITCSNDGLDISLSGGWVYVVYVRTPGGGSAGVPQGEYVFLDGYGREPGYVDIWESSKSVPDDATGYVRTTTDRAYSDNGREYVLFDPVPGEIRIDLEPGVHKLRVVAYRPMRVPANDPRLAGDWGPFELGITNAPTKTSRLEVGVGDCDAAFDAKEQLDNVDQRLLQQYAELGEARREFGDAQFSFIKSSVTTTVSAAAAVVTAGRSSLLKSEAAASTLASSVGTTSALGAALSFDSLWDSWDSGADAQAEFDGRVQEIQELQSRKSSLFDEIERCAGEGYTIPDDYEPLTPSDTQDAVRNGDTEKE